MTDLQTQPNEPATEPAPIPAGLPRWLVRLGGTDMNAEQRKALVELDEAMTALQHAQREVKRLEALRDRRVMRAVAVGVDKIAVAPVAKLSRQRVGQIAAGVEKGAGRGQVAAVARTPRPRGQQGVEARRAALAGGQE